MKNLAKLTLFFSLSFAFLFIAAVALRLLSSWVDFIRIVQGDAGPGLDVASLAWKAIPAALYLSILLGLSYTVRRKMPVFLSILWITVLGCVFTIGGSLLFSRAEAFNPVISQGSPVEGEAGLMLTRSENTMILLKGTGDIRGPRVVSISGEPLIYQESPIGPGGTLISLPPLPFGDATPWFVESLSIDFSLVTRELESELGEDFIHFVIYTFALVLFLASLRFLLELSQWPLANLFLGALVFRLILALEIFINTESINNYIFTFLNGQIPSMLITPVIFCALSILAIIYTLLTWIVRPRRASNE